MDRIAEYFKDLFSGNKNRNGEIGFNIDTAVSEEISFWVDARQVWVDWGDGEKSEEIMVSGLFTHKYTVREKLRVTIYGKGVVDVDVKKCGITFLEVCKCPTLEYLDCSENLMTSLDVTDCRRLYELYCGRNRLQELKLGKYRKLFYISCSCNDLDKLELKGCRNLVNLRCRKNRLHSLDVSSCRKLAAVNIEGNLFNYNELKNFLSTLVIRPQNNVGTVVFHHNIEREDYDDTALRNIINQKGWREI